MLTSDLDDPVLTSRWPVFATTVAELGTINVGVIDLYRVTPGPVSALSCATSSPPPTPQR